ncbi:MAG: class D beta-lactamase [Xanthomonadaceae bacterium]|nr:class D beta-lactamase [Xanthomonadaceae bacterium]
MNSGLKFSVAVALVWLVSIGVEANAQWQEREDWAATFEQAGVAGTIAVLDLRGGKVHRIVYNAERAQQRFSPASTFKVPHALFALDAGIVRDEFQVFEWDGEKRWLDAWNRDQDLRSSMRNSVVWVYQKFAREIGEAREREYLKKIDYGNADPSGGIERFWIEGDLEISAIEQVEFLRRLYYNELPFAVEHQRLVKDLMLNEAGNEWTCEWILRAKTGWSSSSDPGIGWWVGWVEWPEGPVFFALNIDMPNGIDDTAKRKLITRDVLRSLGALPKSDQEKHQ